MARVLPDNSAALVDKSGRLVPVWRRFFEAFGKSLTDLDDSASGLSSSKAAASQPFSESLLIEVPSDKDYTFLSLAINGDITSVVTQCASGTCTATVKINELALGGTANSVSTTKVTQEHSVRNSIRDGDSVTVTISATASATDVSITLRGTQTLA